MNSKLIDHSVTAVITTYKRSWEQIERAVQSVLKQTLPVAELLIVDDNPLGSNVSQTIQQHVAPIPVIRYVSNNGNHGVGAARNTAMREAEGFWIAYLDDDDEWLSTKIEKQMHIAEQYPDAALIFGIGEKVFCGSDQHEYTWSKSIFKESPDYLDMLKNDHVGSASHPMMKTAILKELGGFLTARDIAVEDYELWIRFTQKYPIVGTDEALYIKHMDAGEHVSTGKTQVYRGYIRIFREHKADYDRHPSAKRQIIRNILRVGVKGKHISVIPYFFRWAGTYFAKES